LGTKQIEMPTYSSKAHHDAYGDDQKKWASEQIFMEHDYMALTDVPHVTTPLTTIVEQIRAVGPEKCVIGSDSGSMKLPDNVASMKDFVGRLLEAGITDKEIDFMARKNPGILLGID
jgi:hypothetical protein